MARLKDLYQKEIVPEMVNRFSYKNKLQVPRINKIVINVGVGSAKQDPKHLDNAVSELTLITGQKPVITKAKTSIAGFKLREGMKIGCKVTLRGDRMYEFFDRLLSVSLPRIRDFRGLSPRSFDGRGNYNIGITEQLIFPEVDYDKVEAIRGMNITIATTARSDEEAFELLNCFGFPFKKQA